MRNCLIVVLSFLTLSLSAQHEADNWVFGMGNWINFSTGQPRDSSQTAMNTLYGSTSLSDSLGNLLFYSDGVAVFNHHHDTMPNGSGLLAGWSCPNPCIAFPKPGDAGKYYLFTVSGGMSPIRYGAEYSVIDMSLDNGNGDIIPGQKNIPLLAADSTYETIAGIKHGSRDAYWVILRNHRSPNKILTFLVDQNGVSQTPVVSPTILYFSPGVMQAEVVKASADGKYLIYAARNQVTGHEGMVEVYTFNNITGQSAQKLLFNTGCRFNTGIELSANSQYLYLSNGDLLPTNQYRTWVSQYDMSKVNDLAQFEGSVYRMAFDTLDWTYGNQLLSNNGKIYFLNRSGMLFTGGLCEIANPSVGGAGCNLTMDIMELDGIFEGLPTFVSSFMAEISWTGSCMDDTIQFNSNFYPPPVSYLWNFDDPTSGTNNTSTLANPAHVFTQEGEYNITLTVNFPNGTQQSSNRTVTIFPLPQFELGDTIFVCDGASVTITPGAGYSAYQWSTGATSAQIQISQPGLYWATVWNQGDCKYTDSVWVKNFPEIELIDDNLIKSPTTCGGQTGAITGLQFGGLPPYDITWTEEISGDIVGHTPDLYNLGVGLYKLHLTDANGCTMPEVIYDIKDVGNLLIDTVINTNSFCNQSNALINVIAVSGLGSRIQYFLRHDNDTLMQWHNGIFTDLEPGVYYAWASDSTGCTCVYSDAIIITSPDGPVITDHVILEATAGQPDGTIILTATSATSDTIYYTVNGITLINNGYFDNLFAGEYLCVVTDENGCSTSIILTVPTLNIQYLEALAGNTITCLGQTGEVPLYVNNFNGVRSFVITLNYNPLVMDCIGYSSLNPAIEPDLEPVAFPSSGKILLKWNGKAALTLPGNSLLMKLVFTTTVQGNSPVEWDATPGINRFFDNNGLQIYVEYTTGSLVINSVPIIDPPGEIFVCEGDDFFFNPVTSGGSGMLDYRWHEPEGSINEEQSLVINNITPKEGGNYKLFVTDQNNCIDTAWLLLHVIPLPATNFPSDGYPVPFENEYILETTPGYASYEWSTGDTLWFIRVTEEGEYSVKIKTVEGCQVTDTVIMMNVVVPIKIPSAFTPNGDGLNETFKPIINRPELMTEYHLTIYNRWGQRIFETSDVEEAWDALNALPGVYSWMISYQNRVGKAFEIRGFVTLLK